MRELAQERSIHCVSAGLDFIYWVFSGSGSSRIQILRRSEASPIQGFRSAKDGKCASPKRFLQSGTGGLLDKAGLTTKANLQQKGV
jgi:hypothetical protein